MYLELPDEDGSEISPELERRMPEAPVMILSARDDAEEVARAVGADGAARFFLCVTEGTPGTWREVRRVAT